MNDDFTLELPGIIFYNIDVDDDSVSDIVMALRQYDESNAPLPKTYDELDAMVTGLLPNHKCTCWKPDELNIRITQEGASFTATTESNIKANIAFIILIDRTNNIYIREVVVRAMDIHDSITITVQRYLDGMEDLNDSNTIDDDDEVFPIA